MDRSTMMIDRNILEMLRLKKWDWEPDSRVVYPLTPRSSCKFDSVDSGSSPMLKNSVDPGWKLRDLLLAAKILTNSREKQEYADEAEMRRVFGLLYDVLRYKQILNSVLENVGFWQRYAQFRKRKQLVWLLLYDMHGRKFARVGNNSAVAMRNESLKQVNLLEVEKALLDMKTRVAAGLSRLRIKGSALTLEELLPDHQRVAEGVTWGEEGSIAFGWVNSSKVPTRGIFIEEMKKLGLMLCSGCSPTSELEEHEYVFDPLCPKVVNLHENAREKLASSELVRSHGFVFLERSLCLGAATLVHAFKVGKLSGPIILTHSLAPRHTGYLAELLVDLQDVGRLLVFGLGDKRTHCEAYLQKLGISMQRCKLFSERYTSETKLPEIERATVVLAAPPCSYTGVRDVVDLAIARDGDFRLLESLTSQQEKSPQQPRILLAEQMSTLKYALTRPNVQLVVYEVHTLLPCETADMTRQVVQQVNRMMLDKFQRDHAQRKKSSAKGSTEQISNSEYKSVSSESIAMSLDDSKLNIESEDEVSLDDTSELPKIPEGDLFEVSDLNDVYQRDCTKMVDRGAYVVLIKRKEIVQFNSQFMIEVAEGKGIFGDSTKQLMTLENYKVSTPAEAPQTGRKRRKSSKLYRASSSIDTPSSLLAIQKSQDELDIELSKKNEREWTTNGIYKCDLFQEQKFEKPTQPNNTSNGTIESIEVYGSCHPDGNLKKSARPLSSHYFYNVNNPRKALENSRYDSSVLSPCTPEPTDKYLETKGERMSFDISLKSKQQPYRQILPRKVSRSYRIPFKSRLETVFEQSQSFSYLFPEN